MLHSDILRSPALRRSNISQSKVTGSNTIGRVLAKHMVIKGNAGFGNASRELSFDTTPIPYRPIEQAQSNRFPVSEEDLRKPAMGLGRTKHGVCGMAQYPAPDRRGRELIEKRAPHLVEPPCRAVEGTNIIRKNDEREHPQQEQDVHGLPATGQRLCAASLNPRARELLPCTRAGP